jgi:hypothetical protein
VAFVLIIVGLILVWALRGTARNAASTSRSRRIPVSAFIVGFNFTILGHLMVYRLLYRLDISMNANFLGMIAFTGLAAAGAFLLTRYSPLYLLVVSITSAGLLVLSGFMLPEANLVAVATAAFLSGSLFPRILRGPDRQLARVFVWDGYGAIWGGLAALLVSLLAGFSICQALSGVVLIAASLAVHRSRGFTG